MHTTKQRNQSTKPVIYAQLSYTVGAASQVIARSFAVPLLGERSIVKCSESFECCFSLAVKLSYSCETIQYYDQNLVVRLLVPHCWNQFRKCCVTAHNAFNLLYL